MNELRTILGDVVTRLFTDLVTKDLLTSAETGQWPDALWRAVEENGLTMPLVSEAGGGAGGTWGDAHVVVRAAGRHAVPLPLAETIVASWLLSRAGLEVPTGPLTVAPVHADDSLQLSRGANGWQLRGMARRVPWGRVAHHLVVAGTVDGRTIVALVAAREARVDPDRNLALEPRDTLTFEDTPVLAAAVADGVPADAVWLHGALVRSAQMAGGVEAVLRLAVQYAGERKQFGRAIGNFQAIQHQLAVLAGHSAAASMAAAHAFRAADRGDAAFEIACAKVRAGEAASIAANISHQVHGAIGFTYEHSLHFTTRRLWSWRAEFGGEGHWAAELGRGVATVGADDLWAYVTSR